MTLDFALVQPVAVVHPITSPSCEAVLLIIVCKRTTALYTVEAPGFHLCPAGMVVGIGLMHLASGALGCMTVNQRLAGAHGACSSGLMSCGIVLMDGCSGWAIGEADQSGGCDEEKKSCGSGQLG